MSEQYVVITMSLGIGVNGWGEEYPSLLFSEAEVWGVYDYYDTALSERDAAARNDFVFAFILALTDTGWRMVKEES